MFQLNDDFLKELGLEEMPQEQRKPFLEHIYNELTVRVGDSLSQGMSDEKMDEFARIADRSQPDIDAFLEKHAPNYTQEPMFKRLVEVTGADPGDQRLKNEFAATKWLEVNRPDYREVVAAAVEKLKQEIIANKDVILAGIQQ